MTRILLIDDEPIVGAGLRAVLDAQEDLQVVGEEQDLGRATRTLSRSEPDVIVLDTPAVDDGTFRAIRALLKGRPQAAVLVVSSDGDVTTALRAIMAGATAYLPSRVSTALMVQVVRTVTEGAMVLPRSVGRELAGRLVPKMSQRSALVHLLSTREHRVLELLADGCSNAEIGGELFISEATVKKHVSQILRKLQRRDRLQVALYARDLGLGSAQGQLHEGPT